MGGINIIAIADVSRSVANRVDIFLTKVECADLQQVSYSLGGSFRHFSKSGFSKKLVGHIEVGADISVGDCMTVASNSQITATITENPTNSFRFNFELHKGITCGYR
jgi:hypothetical protein